MGSIPEVSPRAALACVIVAALTACASAHRASRPPAQTEIMVPFDTSPAEALRLTRAAFEAQGFETERGLRGDSIVTTVPREIADGLRAEYLAVVRPTDTGVTVVLRGWIVSRLDARWQVETLGLPKLGADPLTSRTKGEAHLGWSLLQQIANRLGNGGPEGRGPP